MVDADMELILYSEGNAFCLNVGRDDIWLAKENGARRSTNEDHSLMMGQACQREVLEFETIFDKFHFDEDDNGDYEDVDWDEYEEE